MSAKFIDYDQSTLYLLPPSLQDWLPEDHLARFVVEIVDQLDLGSLKAAYAGRGSTTLQSGDAPGTALLRIRHGDVLQPETRAKLL
jgi:hypothetical protein